MKKVQPAVKKDIVLFDFGHTITVQAIVQGLENMGYTVHSAVAGSWNIYQYINDASVFVLHLGGGVLTSEKKQEELVNIVKNLRARRRKIIIVGEITFHHDMVEFLPELSFYPWFDKPVNMDKFERVVNTFEEQKNIKEKILVVDDDPAFCKMIRSNLMDIFQVSVVTSGKQAITFLSQNQVDLVLLDYNMPEMPGPEVLKALRSHEETKRIPVAFLTGIDNKESISQVLALKPQGYILKSATKEALISKIDDVLRANPSQRETG